MARSAWEALFQNVWVQRVARAYRPVRPVVRVGRLLVASGSLYGLGYSSGIRNCLEDREGTVNHMLGSILAKQAHGADLLAKTAKASLLVQRVGRELLAAAQVHLSHSIAREPPSDPESDPRVSRLRALQKLNWQFVVIDDGAVNAFVADVLPGFVFVHRGLVETMNEDELAFVLGHEFSHYLCSHSVGERQMHGAFSLLQIVVLATVDPTGVLSLLLELPIAATVVNLSVVAPISRQHEVEADALGLMLVARTCRDPSRAISAHEALAAIEARHGGDTEHASLSASHPSFRERISALRLLLPEAHALYETSGCARVKRTLKQAGFFRT